MGKSTTKKERSHKGKDVKYERKEKEEEKIKIL